MCAHSLTTLAQAAAPSSSLSAETSTTELATASPTSTNPPAIDWQEQLIKVIAAGKIPNFTAKDVIPVSQYVPKAVVARLLVSGSDARLVRLDDSTYYTLGATGHHERAAKLISQLIKNANTTAELSTDPDIFVKKLVPPQRDKTVQDRKQWYIVLDIDQWAAFAQAAQDTTIKELNLQMERGNKVSHTDQVRACVLRELKELDIHTCKTCTNPILDPDDDQFKEKRQLFVQVGSNGARLRPCSCGHEHAFVLPPAAD